MPVVTQQKPPTDDQPGAGRGTRNSSAETLPRSCLTTADPSPRWPGMCRPAA